MDTENRSSSFKKGLNFIIENKFDQGINFLKDEYQNDPGDISLVYLLVSSYLLTGLSEEIITRLRYEENVSPFRVKIGVIRVLISQKNQASLYDVGKALLARGWSDDANIFFQIHSILKPNNYQSLLPLGETAIKNGQYQKGVSILSKAAENYFKKEKDLMYE